jgi:hypothetical protein
MSEDAASHVPKPSGASAGAITGAGAHACPRRPRPLGPRTGTARQQQHVEALAEALARIVYDWA